MLQGDGGPGKALDQGALDGAQPIGATEITFDIGDKAMECLGRAGRRAGFARLSGWQPVGNWVVSAANFPASPLPVGVTPTTSRRSRRAICPEKWPEAQAERDPAVVVGLFAGFWTACHRTPTFFERGGRAFLCNNPIHASALGEAVVG